MDGMDLPKAKVLFLNDKKKIKIDILLCFSTIKKVPKEGKNKFPLFFIAIFVFLYIHPRNTNIFYPLLFNFLFYIFRLFLLALLTLIIFATVYENTLIAKGFNLNDERDNNGCRTTELKHDDDTNNNNNRIDIKYELSQMKTMNKMNNDKHMKNDLHKLGKK